MTQPDPFAECNFDCPHEMLPRCPWCNQEIHLPAVWSFSHGQAAHSCGFRLHPKEREAS